MTRSFRPLLLAVSIFAVTSCRPASVEDWVDDVNGVLGPYDISPFTPGQCDPTSPGFDPNNIQQCCSIYTGDDYLQVDDPIRAYCLAGMSPLYECRPNEPSCVCDPGNPPDSCRICDGVHWYQASLLVSPDYNRVTCPFPAGSPLYQCNPDTSSAADCFCVSEYVTPVITKPACFACKQNPAANPAYSTYKAMVDAACGLAGTGGTGGTAGAGGAAGVGGAGAMGGAGGSVGGSGGAGGEGGAGGTGGTAAPGCYPACIESLRGQCVAAGACRYSQSPPPPANPDTFDFCYASNVRIVSMSTSAGVHHTQYKPDGTVCFTIDTTFAGSAGRNVTEVWKDAAGNVVGTETYDSMAADGGASHAVTCGGQTFTVDSTAPECSSPDCSTAASASAPCP